MPHVCVCCKSLTSQVFLEGPKEMEIRARDREVHNYRRRLSAVNPLLVRLAVWGLDFPPPSHFSSPRVPFLPSLTVSFVVCKCVFGDSSFGTGWTGIRFESWLLQGMFLLFENCRTDCGARPPRVSPGYDADLHPVPRSRVRGGTTPLSYTFMARCAWVP